MSTNPYRGRGKFMRAMMIAGGEIIRARDPELAAALDVAPPQVSPVESPSHEFVVAGAEKPHSIAYRAPARSIAG